jgi:S1-C subfamily serine protease
MNIFNLDVNLIEWNLKTAQKYEDPIKNVIQRGLQSSCTIFVKTPEGQWSGSGFHIGDGLIVTAGHVIPLDIKQHQIEISFDAELLYPAQIVVSNDQIDAGVISCPQIANLIPSLQLGDSDAIEVGDMIAVIGAPEGFHDTATVGRVSNIHQSLNDDVVGPAWNDVIFIDADILEGSSGGMVIGTDGLVYGTIMGVTGQHAEIGIGENAICPSNKIKALLVQL